MSMMRRNADSIRWALLPFKSADSAQFQIDQFKEKPMAPVVNKRKLNASDLQAIGQLLVEILGGEIRRETRQVILELGDPREIPPPYGQLVESIQGSTLEGKELAHELQEELRVICVMLLAEQI